MIQNTADIRNRNWKTTVSHIYKEDNRVVDLLAHHGHALELGFHFNWLYPTDVDRFIWLLFHGWLLLIIKSV
ncbi:hypothetical protein LINPERPRIM_LOCUS28848 [Linum perenne]